MKTCALCTEKFEHLKGNTHFLTDSIIRPSINEGGVKDAHKGLYWDISNDQLFSDFGFQRETSQTKLEEVLGHVPTDEENAKSKGTPVYSIDDVFCKQCEDRFTKIESDFASKIRKKFRGNTSLASTNEVDITKPEEIKLFRLFWLMQIWRTHVCVEDFTITPGTAEDLRQLIYAGAGADEIKLSKYPLSVTFMYTGSDPLENTFNGSGYALGNRPNIILMNEFVIQFFESPDEIQFIKFHGINERHSYLKFMNFQETSFKVNVLSNERRKSFLSSYHSDDVVKPRLQAYYNLFRAAWLTTTGREPYYWLWQTFIWGLTDYDHLPEAEKLSRGRFKSYLRDFIIRYECYCNRNYLH